MGTDLQRWPAATTRRRTCRRGILMISRCFLRGFWGTMLLSLPGVAFAQSEDLFHHFTLSAGAGLTTITGANAGKLDHGGNLQLNGGYFFNRYFGVTGNFMFSDLGITRAELDSLNMPNGS